jgi:beta-mannosidase
MHNLNWRLTWRVKEAAADHEWISTSVPGAAQRDWGLAAGLPDPHRDPGAYGWMEDVWWIYRAELPEVAAGDGEHVRFIAGGIDYACAIYRGDVCIHRQEGMFTPVDLDFGSRVMAGEVLEIRIAPVPKLIGETGRAQARKSCKPAMSYGWDWHPRLVPSGIWRPCRLLVRGTAVCTGLQVIPPEGSGPWQLLVNGSGSLPCQLRDPDGRMVIEKNLTLPAELEVANPRLWWPTGHGEQALYELEVGGQRHRIGFRTLRLVMNGGSWLEPALFPKSRSAAPATFEINGRRIFAKGSNWIAPRLFPGEISREVFAGLIDLAVSANFNCLRVWGGGIVNPREFYELCDAAGLLVIQEFPLACNDYPDDPAYLAVLDQESRSIISALRHHPSLAAWSGGNELFNNWSGMTDQHHALRLLNRNCYDLDRHRPFLPTMPIEGMAHGPYTYFDKEQHMEVTALMQGAANTAYTEFGQAGPAPLDCLKKMIPAEELFPPRPGTAWELHHGLNAFYPESWLGMNILEHLFGESPDIETLVRRGQWLQAFGYQMVFEEARRQWPHCSMALNWCFNEIWPCAANNSLLAWPDLPKPAYHAVAASCRPALISARLATFCWEAGKPFRAQLWLLNDSPHTIPAGSASVTLVCGDERLEAGNWDFPPAPPQVNLPGPDLQALIPPHWSAEQFRLDIGADVLSHHYDLKLGPQAAPLRFDPGAHTQGARRLNQ